MPEWTQSFFEYEQYKLDHETANQRTERVRVDNRQIERGILPQQAPLGSNENAAQLRQETDRSNAGGNLSRDMGEGMEVDEETVPPRNARTNGQRRPAPTRQPGRRPRRRPRRTNVEDVSVDAATVGSRVRVLRQ